jgi:predicted nucleic acid-binding protein
VELGLEHGVTVYDAAYLAVAEIEGCMLVTADLRFCQRVEKLARVMRLSDAE